MTTGLLRFEFPVNEKIRTFMRLADLFKQLEWYAAQDDVHDHQAAIAKYFEIQEVTVRGDQKNDILHELERYRSSLSPLTNNLQVDQSSLSETLEAIKECCVSLSSVGIRISHLSGQNDFLKLLGQRSSIPAGTCQFDLPAYHYWLHLPDEERKAHLRSWIDPLKSYSKGIEVILQLLRSTAEINSAVAKRGGYARDLQGKSFTLVQIYVDPKYHVTPKVSANRYMLSVNLIPISFDQPAPRTPSEDIPFKLGLCNM